MDYVNNNCFREMPTLLGSTPYKVENFDNQNNG